MKDLFEKFQHYLVVEKYVSTNTMQAYTRDIEQFLDFLKENTRIRSLRKITTQHVKDFLKYLKLEKNIGAKSTSRKLSALKTMANYLSKYHQVAHFTKGVAFPKLPKQLPKHLSEDQIQSILMTASEDQSVTGQRNKVIICLLYACGMRVSELIDLDIENINFEERFVQVFGKGEKERVVPFPEEMAELLKGYIKYIHPMLIQSTKESNIDCLFPVVYAGKAERISRQAVWKMVKNVAKKAGLIHDISPHVLRHSLATHLLKKGTNLRILQTLLGHEKLNTVQVYTHLDISHLQDLYDTYHPRAK